MKNSEQPAFPISNNNGFCTSFEYLKQPHGGAIGLTKREYFAAMAICAGKSAKESLDLSDELLNLFQNGKISDKTNE